MKIDFKAAYAAMNTAERMTVSVLHQLLADIKQNPERYVDTEKGLSPVQLIEDIEHTLQGIWKFPRDAKYHTHWLEIKGCTCPKMDNKDPFYYGNGKLIVSDCPWHWRDEGN